MGHWWYGLCVLLVNLNMNNFNFTDKRLNAFRKWLEAAGAQLLIATNPYEVIRFRSSNGVSILHKRNDDMYTLTGEMPTAWNAFCTGKGWDSGVVVVKSRPKKTDVLIETLLARDGNRCFYCHQGFEEDNYTIEHLLSRAHGGSNHISNLVLAHEECNKRVGHMSISEKVKHRESLMCLDN